MRAMPARPGPRSLLRLIGRRHPRTRGTLRVDEVADEVTIRRDRWGIPHVEASSDADAWFGLGFCHGQDRGWQLEVLVRAGRGTLAEMLGRPALPIDRLSRTLGLHRLAAAQLAVIDADIRETVDGYVAGINAAASASPRPHELVLLRTRRTPWLADDVLAFLGLQSLALAGNWDTELARLRILMTDGPDALRAVDPTYAAWLPATVPVGSAAGPSLDRLASDLSRLRDLVAGPGASNAWAVAGTRTVSGAPILANDPHLSPSIPAPWYLAHLRTAEWSVAGASFVGSPAFPSGHNGHIAWGITAACSDSADLFWEELVDGGASVRGPHGREPVERRAERISVRGAEAVVEDVVTTSRGPILTPVLDGVGVTLSLRATWLEPVAVRGFMDVSRVRDFASFRDAFQGWPGPALNVVYADAAGHIGWQLIGTLPRRRAGNGTLPLPAWVADSGWHGEHMPFDELPWILDPDEGFVASANNAPRPDAPDAPFLGVDWLDGYRAARIVEALRANGGWDVAATQALQADVMAAPWGELRPLILGVAVADTDARIATALLSGWDGELAAGSAAASVYELTVAELAASLARDGAPAGWPWAIGAGFGDAVPRTTFGARSVSHVVARLSEHADPRPLVEGALATAVRTLRALAGDHSTGWAWGTLRPVRLRHLLAASGPIDRVLNVGPVPLGGDSNTISQAGVRPLDPLANPAAIANHRTVIDLADPERSRYVLAGGQSGNPLSRHYADLFGHWQRGEAVPIAWAPEAVRAATVATLTLRPGSYISPSNAG